MNEEKRRTTIKNLVESGRLQAGSEIACEQPGGKGRLLARITSDGKIRLENGREFESPSGAAKAARGVVLNGWVAWKDVRSGQTLAEIRKGDPS